MVNGAVVVISPAPRPRAIGVESWASKKVGFPTVVGAGKPGAPAAELGLTTALVTSSEPPETGAVVVVVLGAVVRTGLRSTYTVYWPTSP